MSQTNNHAARLREMAAEESNRAREGAEFAAACDNSGIMHAARAHAAIAAESAINAQTLLAGAEALEAVRVIADGEGDAQVIAQQALAKMEGL